MSQDLIRLTDAELDLVGGGAITVNVNGNGDHDGNGNTVAVGDAGFGRSPDVRSGNGNTVDIGNDNGVGTVIVHVG